MIRSVWLLLVLSSFVRPTNAITCDIKSQSFNDPDTALDTKVGFIDVNGVRAVSFQTVTGLAHQGLWVVAVTPACEVLDVMQFIPPTTDTGSFYDYIASLPLDTIIVGASADNVEPLFDATIGCNDDTFIGCDNRESVYALTALGLQFRYTDGPVAAGFVTQKGHPEKAQWMLESQVYGPVGFEGQITTPDVYACVPRQPIMDLPRTMTPGRFGFPLQRIECDGYINAWRFYAKSTDQVRFSVWRQSGNNNNFYSVSNREVTPSQTGDNLHCVADPMRVEVGDFVAVYDVSGTVIPIADPSHFDTDQWPNCKSQLSSLGITDMDLVPVYYKNGGSSQNGINEDVFEGGPGLGAIAFHPYMSKESDDRCSCTVDKDCTSWDRFAFCDGGTCKCKTGFMIDYNTLTCIRSNVAEDRDVFVSDFTNGAPAYAVDGSGSGTCITVADADRPWLVVDLGMETAVHSVVLTPGSTSGRSTSGRTEYVLNDEANKGGLYWATVDDAFGTTFCRPPCISFSGSVTDGITGDTASAYNTIVTDVSEGSVKFTVYNGNSWDTTGVNKRTYYIDYTAYEPALTNFEISVSNTESFEPGTFTPCTHYAGSVTGQAITVDCDEVVLGRYLKIHLPGDGLTDGTGACALPNGFSICDMQVQGLPARSNGFPCIVDEDCSVPFTNQYLVCENEVCVCADNFLNHNSLDICIDIDECFTDDFNGDGYYNQQADEFNGRCEHLCVNTPGSYHCECLPGYELSPDNHSCQDKNECTQEASNIPLCTSLCGQPVCLNCSKDTWPCFSLNCRSPSASECEQVCDNSIFPYECSCFDGYYLSDDAHRCLDINECLNMTDDCDDEHGLCANNIGSFVCSCEAGWMLNADGHTCDDMDECLMNNGGCDHICENIDGSYVCTCRDGYALLPNLQGCVDVDECFLDTDGCDGLHGVCDNTVGAYTCSCADGWQELSGATSHACVDENECDPDHKWCEQTCSNIEGSYTCGCYDGYVLSPNGFSCIDVDECEDGSSATLLCEYPALCDNKASGFQCGCPEGMGLNEDGLTCSTEAYVEEPEYSTGISKGSVIGLSVLGALLGLMAMGLLGALCYYCCCRPGGMCMNGGGGMTSMPMPRRMAPPPPPQYQDNVEYVTMVERMEPVEPVRSMVSYPTTTYPSYRHYHDIMKPNMYGSSGSFF